MSKNKIKSKSKKSKSKKNIIKGDTLKSISYIKKDNEINNIVLSSKNIQSEIKNLKSEQNNKSFKINFNKKSLNLGIVNNKNLNHESFKIDNKQVKSDIKNLNHEPFKIDDKQVKSDLIKMTILALFLLSIVLIINLYKDQFLKYFNFSF